MRYFGLTGLSLMVNFLAGFSMMPGMQLIPQHMMAQRPLFPQAVMGQQKPTFPAYSNATISAPPTTNLGNSTGTNSASSNENQKPPTIPQNSGPASKIMHPPEDISLEEIRARKPQYRIHRANSSSSSATSSVSSIATSIASTADVVAAINKANESKMVAAAQEVSYFRFSLSLSFNFS